MADKLMQGRRGLIMGVANDHSIAWAIARAAHEQGAELGFTYQGDAFLKRAKPLVDQVEGAFLENCDVTRDGDLERVFDRVSSTWGGLDFVVHAIAFSDRNELTGEYVNTTRDNFRLTLDVSCYTLTAVCQRAMGLMKDGGSALPLTYSGAERVMPHYNVMGVAKAALEASVRYLAED